MVTLIRSLLSENQSRWLRRLAFSTLAAGLLCSCALQKRRYMPGFSLSLKGRAGSVSHPQKALLHEAPEKMTTMVAPREVVPAEEPELAQSVTKTEGKPQRLPLASIPDKIHQMLAHSLDGGRGIAEKQVQAEEPTRKFNGLALVGLFFSLICAFFILYGVYLSVFNGFLVAALSIGLGLLIFFPAFIMDIIALSHERIEQEQFYGSWMALVGLILCFGSVFFAIYYLLFRK